MFGISFKRYIIIFTIIAIVLSTTILSFIWFNKHEPQEMVNTFVTLENFTVRVNNAEGENNDYVRLKIILEVNNDEEIAIVQRNIPKIRDIIYSYLYSLKISDISKGSAIYFLREEITLRINKVLSTMNVKNVLFDELIVG